MASVIQKLNCKFLFNLNLKLSLWLVAIKSDNTALDGLYYKSSWGRSLPLVDEVILPQLTQMRKFRTWSTGFFLAHLQGDLQGHFVAPALPWRKGQGWPDALVTMWIDGHPIPCYDFCRSRVCWMPQTRLCDLGHFWPLLEQHSLGLTFPCDRHPWITVGLA